MRPVQNYQGGYSSPQSNKQLTQPQQQQQLPSSPAQQNMQYMKLQAQQQIPAPGGSSPQRVGTPINDTNATNNNNNNNPPPTSANNLPSVVRDEEKKKSFTSVHGYVLHEILGKGSFGQVFKATRSNRTFAIKMIDKALIRKKNLQKYVNNEVKVMRDLKNPNTVRLFEAFEDKDVLYLVMECCNQGTLFNHILKMKPGETECIRIFAQIMRGFIEIHEKHILHRDLKPSNIFIKDGVFKIADFGLAIPKALGSSYCGTSYFMAPEILNKQVHDYKVDLWSMGVILFFMIFREYPFKNSAALLDEITQKTIPVFDPYKCLKHPPKAATCSPGLLDLFQRIFVMDPAKRISFKELYGLEIFSEFFSANELRNSSKIYHDLEKKLPEEAAPASGTGTTTAAAAEAEDDDDDDDDDDEDYYADFGDEVPKQNKEEEQKAKKKSKKKVQQQQQQPQQQLNSKNPDDSGGNKLKVSKFKPPSQMNSIPLDNQQTTNNNQQQQGSPKNVQKISDYARGAVSIKETLVSSTKTTGISHRIEEKKPSVTSNHTNNHTNNTMPLHQAKLSPFQQQQEKGVVANTTAGSGNSNSNNSNEDSRFGDEDGEFDVDIDEEDPQIEMKNIKMLLKKTMNNRYFGPKAFHNATFMLPKPKAQRLFEEDENSIPNAPSSITGLQQSYHSINLQQQQQPNQQQQHHFDQLSHGSHSNHFKLSQQDQMLNNTLNVGSSNSLKKPSMQQIVDTNHGMLEQTGGVDGAIDVPEESDLDEESEKQHQLQQQQQNNNNNNNNNVQQYQQQKSVRKSLPISFPEKEAVNSEENLRKMPFRKAPSLRMNIIDSAVKDKLRKKIIEECELVFEQHVQVYLYEIGIYGILGDTIDSLNVLNLNSSTQSLVNYLLAKLLLYYSTRLLNSLQTQKNIFNLEHFDTFTTSAPALLLIGKISRDIDQWSTKFSLFYYGINLEADIQSDEVRKIVTEELVETDFEKQLKIPTRLVLDLIFKASYKMGRSCSQELQASGILRTSLYILLSMLINNVFDRSRVKEYLYHYFIDPQNSAPTTLDFVDFSLWTAQANRETLLNQIHHLVKFVFGERKLLILKSKF